jgi:hypothetical protein
MPVLCLCRSCRGHPAFGQTTVEGFRLLRPAPALLGGVVSRQLAQPALPAGASLLAPRPWDSLGRQPAYCLARSTPPKSSPRQSRKVAPLNMSFVHATYIYIWACTYYRKQTKKVASYPFAMRERKICQQLLGLCIFFSVIKQTDLLSNRCSVTLKNMHQLHFSRRKVQLHFSNRNVQLVAVALF